FSHFAPSFASGHKFKSSCAKICAEAENESQYFENYDKFIGASDWLITKNLLLRVGVKEWFKYSEACDGDIVGVRFSPSAPINSLESWSRESREWTPFAFLAALRETLEQCAKNLSMQ
ncbi:MAG: hypothetical protein ACKVRN_11525, partial [Pyrinomonadaceae bacterium]